MGQSDMDMLLATTSLLLLAMTLASLLRAETWWIRGLDFPRQQFFWLAMVLLVLSGILAVLQADASLSGPTRVAIVACLLCLGYNGWLLLPYSALSRVTAQSAAAPQPGNSVSVLVANVLQTNRDAAPLLDYIRLNSPDIVVTLETDQWWQEQLRPLQASYPSTLFAPKDNLYGMHVFSRLPLTDGQIEYLVQSDVPSMHALLSLPGGRKVRLHALHPAPPAPTENETSTPRDAELVAVARSVAEGQLPAIVVGDLNDAPWSDTIRLFLKVGGLLDPRVGRGLFNTFHAGHWFLRWPLDHVFHSPHFSVVDIRRSPAFGSDHFALQVTLVLEHSGELPPEADAADPEEDRWADEKTAREDVSADDVPRPGDNSCQS